jgi:uncharacterized protein
LYGTKNLGVNYGVLFTAWGVAGVMFAALLILRSNRMPDTPPAPTTYLTDNVGVMTTAQHNEIESKLAAYDTKTGHQILVWVGATTGGEAPSSFCPRAFEAWGVGDAGENDGVVIFVFTADDVRGVVVGAGLTQAIPDADATHIAAAVIAPKVQAGEYAKGITDGYVAIADAIAQWEATQ